MAAILGCKIHRNFGAKTARLTAGAKLLCERGESCLGDLFVFLGCGEARADAADHLAVGHHRDRSLQELRRGLNRSPAKGGRPLVRVAK